MTLISQKMGIHEWSYDNDISNDQRYRVPLRDTAVALNDIRAEVELGYDDKLAYLEAERCLNCDIQTVFTGQLCIECDACVDICPMDCITFTENGEEEELRTRLSAPAPNLEQDLYIGNSLKTGRIMVKDEDVCLHCGLCAERCPTGAWDMQQILHRHDTGRARMPQPITSVNDFVVKFANVNGSGSASANALFAKSVLRMGIPASSRNIFPSNIQGLPTWYEVRISEDGHLGRRGGVDMMVAMNPQTWDEDVAEIEPGGYLLYDSTKPMPPSKFRDDINVIGAPLTEICNRTYDDARQRQLFKNIIYLGVLSALLDMDVPAIEKLIGEQFRGKDALIKPNLHALHLGRDWAKAELDCPIGLRLERRDKVGDRIFVTGNDAAALGAVYGGATVCAWYPITPSSSLAEAFAAHCAGCAATRRRKRPLRDHPGRGRAGLDRHGDRRRLERRARVHRDLRPRHLADAGIHRPRLFRRNPGGHFRHPARQPLDRHADPHAAGRHPLRRLCLARRHQARAAVPAGPERGFHLCRRRARPRRPAADPDLRHARSRYRHERLAGAAAQMGPGAANTTAARS